MNRGAILVTGGSSGIGAAIVATITSTGRRVGIVSRRPPPTGPQERFERRPPLDWIEADLTDAAATRAAIHGWVSSIPEPLDGLVLSAASYGHGGRHPALATPLAEWDEVMAINLRGQFVVVSSGLPHLLARPRAMILSISSPAAIEAAPGRAHYAASKAGAVAFFRALSDELADTHVSVVQAMPKNQVDTPGLRARRPPGFSFAGYDAPSVFNRFTLEAFATLGKEFDGRILAIGSDGRWEDCAPDLPRAVTGGEEVERCWC